MTSEDFSNMHPDWYEEFNAAMGGQSGDSSDGTCQDDPDYVDSGGDGCEWYYDNADQCGEYDNENTYTAYDACCACGGGYDESGVLW